MKFLGYIIISSNSSYLIIILSNEEAGEQELQSEG